MSVQQDYDGNDNCIANFLLFKGQDVLVQQLRRYRSEGSLDQLGREDHGIPKANENINDELTELANAEQRGSKRHPESITSSTERY